MATFAAVVSAGGFTAAARELKISKQTVSDQVARLETSLGVRLLERTTRKIRPTEAGMRFSEHCVAIVERAEEAQREAQNRNAEPTGALRIASTVTFGELYLIDVVAEFLRDWPRVHAEVVLADRLIDPLAEGFDVAFWPRRPADTSFHARVIGPAYTYFVAHPSYLARFGTPPSASDLGDARVIEWTSRGPRKHKPVLRVSSARGALTAVRRGVGIARLPSVLIVDDVAAGDLQLLFGGEPATSSDIHAVYPSHRFLAPKVRRFLDLTCSRVAPMQPLSPALA